MSYRFELDQRWVLKVIHDLTLEKANARKNEIFQRIPQEWKNKGCGDGELSKSLQVLWREGFINVMPDSSLNFGDNSFSAIHLTSTGYAELQHWWFRYWKQIASGIVTLSTLVAAIFEFLNYLKQP